MTAQRSEAMRAGAVELTAVWGLRLPTSIRLPRRLDLSFDGLLSGDGWHPWEAAEALAFRWMGPREEATVELAVDRSIDLVVDLGIYMTMDPAFRDRLRITADDDPSPLAHADTVEGISFTLPQRVGDVSSTTISIWAGPGTFNPPDPRSLSVAFSHLRVRPAKDGPAEESRLVLRERLAQQLRAAGDEWPMRYEGEPCVIAAV